MIRVATRSVPFSALERTFHAEVAGDPPHAGEVSDRSSATPPLVPAGSVVILGGSLPPGLPPDTYRRMVLGLKERGIRAVVDTSGPALAAVLAAGPALIKPNVEEAAEVLGRALVGDEDVLEAARELRQRGAERVVISQCADGAIGVGPDGSWKAIPPRVDARSTVGSGDSMVAGMAIALNEGKGLDEALRLGTAAGAATALTPGTQLCRPEDVNRLLPRVVVNKLSPRPSSAHKQAPSPR